MAALYAAAPRFVPKPYGWEPYLDINSMPFFLCYFRYSIIPRQSFYYNSLILTRLFQCPEIRGAGH